MENETIFAITFMVVVFCVVFGYAIWHKRYGKR
jgi:hypothetical protein